MTESRYSKYKESNRKYYETHKEQIAKKHKEWRKRNPNYYREYRKKHPEMYNTPRDEWKKDNPEKHEIHKKVYHNLDKYPLGSECIFCGATEDLQRAHLDYEDDGHNYVTACRSCHWWMDSEGVKER